MEHHIVPMSKRKFRIGDLADELKVKKYVIRFWEKEFELKSDRSDGGQRFYTEDDLNLFSKIKELLYRDGFTIAGARKQLEIDIPAVSTYQGSSMTTNEDFGAQAPEVAEQSEHILTGACLDSDSAEKQEAFSMALATFKEQLLEMKKRIDQL